MDPNRPVAATRPGGGAIMMKPISYFLVQALLKLRRRPGRRATTRRRPLRIPRPPTGLLLLIDVLQVIWNFL